MIRIKLLMILAVAAITIAALPLAAESAPPAGVPASAVQAADGYHFTDAQGREWVYRPTAFGIVRISKTEASATKAAMPLDNLGATDHGDTVSFARSTPFGVMRWERKKSELDAAERAAWERRK